MKDRTTDLLYFALTVALLFVLLALVDRFQGEDPQPPVTTQVVR